VDRIEDRDRVVGEVAVAARRHLREGITLRGELFGDRDDRVLDVLGAVMAALPRLEQRPQRVRVDFRNGAVDGDVAERVAIALIDGDDDVVFVARLVELRLGRDDLEVGVAPVVVEAAQQLLVGAQTLFVINVVARQERQEVRLLRRDDVAQAPAAIGVVADEGDRANLGPPALVDMEDDVDAAAFELLGRGGDGRVVAPDARIGRLDGLDVHIHRLGRVGAARLQLDGVAQLRVLELLVAVEQNLVDDGLFAHLDHQGPADLVDVHGREQSCSEQPLHRFVEITPVEADARADADIVANRFGVDALVAAHLDSADHGRVGGRCAHQLDCDSPRHHHKDGKRERCGGAQHTRSCLHWAFGPSFLVVPTARNREFAAENSYPYYPYFAYTQGFWLTSVY